MLDHLDRDDGIVPGEPLVAIEDRPVQQRAPVARRG